MDEVYNIERINDLGNEMQVALKHFQELLSEREIMEKYKQKDEDIKDSICQHGYYEEQLKIVTEDLKNMKQDVRET